MKSIEERIIALEKEQRELKALESKEAWDKWFKEGEAFLNTMVNKAFVVKKDGHLLLVKVNGFKKCNYTQNVDWKGWFEIQTEGYFTIRNAKHIYGRGVDLTGTFGTFAFRKRNNKSKLQYTSILDYKEFPAENCAGVDTSKLMKIGYQGDKYMDDNYPWENKPERSVKNWLVGYWGWYEAPDGMYEECKALIDAIACETDKIWEKYEKVITDCRLVN